PPRKPCLCKLYSQEYHADYMPLLVLGELSSIHVLCWNSRIEGPYDKCRDRQVNCPGSPARGQHHLWEANCGKPTMLGSAPKSIINAGAANGSPCYPATKRRLSMSLSTLQRRSRLAPIVALLAAVVLLL